MSRLMTFIEYKNYVGKNIWIFIPKDHWTWCRLAKSLIDCFVHKLDFFKLETKKF